MQNPEKLKAKLKFEDYVETLHKERLLSAMNSEKLKIRKELEFKETRFSDPIELLNKSLKSLNHLNFQVTRFRPYLLRKEALMVNFGIQKISLFSLKTQSILQELGYPQGVSLIEYSNMWLSDSKRFVLGEKIPRKGKSQIDKISLKTGDLWSFVNTDNSMFSFSGSLLYQIKKLRNLKNFEGKIKTVKVVKYLKPNFWKFQENLRFSTLMVFEDIFEDKKQVKNPYEMQQKEVKVKVLKDYIVVFQNLASNKNLRSGLDFYSSKTKKRLLKYRSVQKLRPGVREIDFSEFKVKYFLLKTIFSFKKFLFQTIFSLKNFRSNFF